MSAQAVIWKEHLSGAQHSMVGRLTADTEMSCWNTVVFGAGEERKACHERKNEMLELHCVYFLWLSKDL